MKGTLSFGPARLQTLAGENGADQSWTRRFDAMIAYAESRGWVSDAGELCAHVEVVESW